MKQMTISIGKESITLNSDDKDFSPKISALLSLISESAMSASKDEDFKADGLGMSVDVSDKKDDEKDGKKFENNGTQNNKTAELNQDDGCWL
ncbi:hypothetical protein [Enterobacter sp. PTB]|uniref:hypothetical protein n=1 Tax=Enterobacter sp. PTB TaxID=3143437 RepID=UPI003DA990B1